MFSIHNNRVAGAAVGIPISDVVKSGLHSLVPSARVKRAHHAKGGLSRPRKFKAAVVERVAFKGDTHQAAKHKRAVVKGAPSKARPIKKNA